MASNPKFREDLNYSYFDLLGKTPRGADGASMASDIRRLHPELLADSIAEAAEAAGKGTDTRERSSVMKIYTRKTKEMAALYPILLAFEGGLRNRLAAEIYQLFGDDCWWKDIRAAMKGGLAPSSVKLINNVPVTSFFANYVAEIITYIDGEKLKRSTTLHMACGLEFLSKATFGQMRYLIINNWTEFGKIFTGRKHGPRQVTKNDFTRLTKTIMDLRNDLYHHRPVSDRQGCVDACERLMDHLDYHLGSFDRDLAHSRYIRPTYLINVTSRHDVLISPLLESFRGMMLSSANSKQR